MEPGPPTPLQDPQHLQATTTACMLVLNDLRVSQFENEVRVVKRLFNWRQTPCIYTTLDYLLSEERRTQENTQKPHWITDNVVSKF